MSNHVHTIDLVPNNAIEGDSDHIDESLFDSLPLEIHSYIFSLLHIIILYTSLHTITLHFASLHIYLRQHLPAAA